MIALPFLINKMHHLFNQIPSILDGTLSMNSDAISNIGTVGFMLSMSDKTEEPTPKKKKDARKQGNIAKSAEVNKAMTFIAILVVIYMMSGSIISELQGFIVNILSGDFSMTMNDNTIKIFGILGSLIQTGLFFSMESLKPKFSKLNPLTGLKNMFSMKAIVNLIKSMVVICIMIYLGYSFMSKNFEGIIKSGDIYLPYMFNIVLDLIKSILTSITLAVAVVAVLDYGYEKFSHKKGLKMTKQEVKDGRRPSYKRKDKTKTKTNGKSKNDASCSIIHCDCNKSYSYIYSDKI